MTRDGSRQARFFLENRPWHPIFKKLSDFARRQGAELHLVGGFLRDNLLGRPMGKLDLDVAAPRGSVALAKQFADENSGAFVLLDEARGVARAIVDIEGTSCQIDFADYRAKTLEEDLGLRDFTVNALALPLSALQKSEDLGRVLVDPLGARADLAARILRACSPKTFQDDPVRALRAFSLKGALGFDIEGKTLDQLKQTLPGLPKAAFERLRDEMFDILAVSNSAALLRQMDALGIIDAVLPETRPMRGLSQGPYHHLDIWAHSMETLAQVEGVLAERGREEDLARVLSEEISGGRRRFQILKWACLWHDMGKPMTRRVGEDGKIRFIGHDLQGAALAEDLCLKWKLSTKEAQAVARMVALHLRPGYLCGQALLTDRAKRKFYRDAGGESAAVLLLYLADRRATRGPLADEALRVEDEKTALGMIGEYFERLRRPAPVRIVSGDDLIQELGLVPGPALGEILDEIEQAREEGTVRTRDEALEFARKLVRRSP